MPPTEINKPVKKAFQGMLTQKETNYTPLTAKRGEACANCRWFLAYGDCFIVQGNPEPILATGYCDRHEMTPAEQPDAVEQLAATVAESVTDALNDNAAVIADALSTYPLSKELKPQKLNIAERLWRTLSRGKSQPEATRQSAFVVYKGSDGLDHWHAIYTNNYEDREAETLSEKSHDRYIGRLDMGLVPMPTLQAWHTKGTDHGEADVIWRNGHFIHAVGHFFDTPAAKHAVKYYEKNAHKLKMSHTFVHPDWAFDGKTYDDYNTIEITTLPTFAAANLYTSFERTKEMPLTNEKRRYLADVLGEAELKTIEDADAQREKSLNSINVAFKDFSDVLNPAAPAPAQPVPVSPSAPAAQPVQMSTHEKSLAVLYTELQGNYNELLQFAQKSVDGQLQLAKRQKAFEDRYEAETSEWQKAFSLMAERLNLPIERAAHSPATLVKKDNGLTPREPSIQENGGDNEVAWFGAKSSVPVLNQ